MFAPFNWKTGLFPRDPIPVDAIPDIGDNQQIVAKFFHPMSSWYWYLMNQAPEDPDYLWGIVKGFEVEVGSFSLAELEATKIHGLGMERDLGFKPCPALEVYRKLNEGIHV